MTIDSTSISLNKFKKYRMYTCADCGQRQAIAFSRRYRAKRIQCKACGSYYLDISKQGKKEELYKNQRLILAAQYKKADR